MPILSARAVVTRHEGYIMPTYVGVSAAIAATADEAASIAPALPAGATTNDWMLLLLGIRNATAGTVDSVPAGWDLVGGALLPSGVGNTRMWVYEKFHDGSESAPVVEWTGDAGATANDALYGVVLAWRNVDQAAPFIDFTTVGPTGAVSSVSMPSLSSGRPNSVPFAFIGLGNDDAVIASATGETGGDWTELFEYPSTIGSDFVLAAQSAELAAPGTISGGTAALTGGTPGTGVISFVIQGRRT